MRAYEACRHLVETIGPRWIGSEGERRAGDWIEAEFARAGLETRRLWFDCPAWDYRSTRLVVDGRAVSAGAQMFSAPCDVEAALARIEPDGRGGFAGDVAGKIALTIERGTGGVLGRSKLLASLRASGALAIIGVSGLSETWSTKMFRDPKSDLPAAGVSARDGAGLLARAGARARLVIDATPRPGKTSVIIGETGPANAPVVLVGAHYDAAPYSPGASDNASGVAVLLDLAERFSGLSRGASRTTGRDSPPAAGTVPTRRMRFAAFGGHEFGGDDAKAFGSKSYARTRPEELKRIELMFNLDGGSLKGSQPQLGVTGRPALLARVRTYAGRQPDVLVAEGPPDGSDHGVFVEAGIDTVWLRATDPLGYYAQAYHSPLDDLRWVGETEMARAADLAFDLLLDLMR